ncbi:uncharacterized protein LOC112082919 [Eutrema salsugineum]|uniref:uncharacterized protein LOC112082919 n=1 Tax=Eutrema salsugineum TaxID=72664 RepID=UPI000CED272C|nr:uncharacterized protein LOC112082919 [Eutrema salsugineum]
MAAERDRDAEIEAIKAKICEMNSKVHRATSSAPEIDRVLQETQNTPFTHRIASTPFCHVSKVKLPPYAGDTDPTQYLTAFTIAMGRAHFTPEEREAGHCQLFVENLVGPALTWFSRLETHSIDSIKALSTAFLKHYSIFIQRSASTADLWALSQGPKESLRSFIERFKATTSRASVSDDSAIPALRKTLHFDSAFKDELKLNAPHILEDALHRAGLHIEIEEEMASLRKLASQKNPPQKEKAQDEYHEPRQHYDEEYQRRQAATFLISDAPTSCPVEEAPAVFHVDNRPGMVVPTSSQQYYHQPHPSNKWYRTVEAPPPTQAPSPAQVFQERAAAPATRDYQAFCEYHQLKGHTIEQCRKLQEALLAQYQKGGIRVPDQQQPRGRGRNDNRRRQDNRAQQDNHRQRSPSRENDRVQPVQQLQQQQQQQQQLQQQQQQVAPRRQASPPLARTMIGMIMGGLLSCNDSVRSIKVHEWKSAPTEMWVAKIRATNAQDTSGRGITFSEEDAEGVDQPHNDPLVIQIRVADCNVTRVLVDTGSSVDLIFKEALEKMDLHGVEMKPTHTPLTGFAGDTITSIGTIKLSVYVGRVTKIVKFTVVDRPAIYNIILGTPWLHSMKAVTSTYHQCLKFPNQAGTFTVRSDQRISRSCFIIEHKLRNAARTQLCATISRNGVPACNVVGPELPGEPSQADRPLRDLIVQVNIDPDHNDRCVGIGADLKESIKTELIGFLKQNVSSFAWSTSDMPSINPAICSHELNVDPTFRPIKQKRRKLGAERAQAMNDEVDRQTAAGQITELKYPDWLANPVVVKKKNSKWRVCVDFTDLNKACPKDCFPLPRIDQVVEATAGNELLSFMDAFSGYNQIFMHPDDREKTTFITDRGTYCYKVMPFGLKNAGATYQCLVNKMFADQLGCTMEVYIDDMLVKSMVAGDHVGHLKRCFKTLNEYGMKLNPAKCTFGVTSGEFLGYVVTQHEIEANPKQIQAVLELQSPKNTREVQHLTGRIAALNRFISRSTDKCVPFYQLLRGNKKFEWDDKCELAFQQLKEYISTPPVLAKPEDGETLYLYIAVSTSAVSGVLVREDRGEQKPVFYVSKFQDGAESRYPTIEKLALAVVTAARKLRSYFQSHTVAVLTTHPLRTILHSPSQSGKMAKWAVELSEYDIDYRGRTAAKSQVLADFLVELAPELTGEAPDEKWSLHVDGSASKHGSGVGIRLESPTHEVLEESFRLAFQASNNEAEYEALIAGLRLAKEIGVRKIQTYCDSQLVANQFSVANALAALATTSDTTQRRVIPVESIDSPSIELPKGICLINDFLADDPIEEKDAQDGENLPPPPPEPVKPDWRANILSYIISGTVPDDRWTARRLKKKAAKYFQTDGNIFR